MSKSSTTCVSCNRKFLSYPSANRKYCSRYCWAASRKGVSFQESKQIARTCKRCGTKFMRPPSAKGTFCSKECSVAATFQSKKKPWNYHHNRETVRCKQCGKSFSAPASNRRIFCSKSCADAARVGTPAHNKQEGAHLKCESCGKVFRVAENRRHAARFCSQGCSAKSKSKVTGREHPLWKPKPVRTCRWCGVEFEIKPCYAKGRYQGQNRGRYCSGFCRGSASSAAQNGRQSSIERLVIAELTERRVHHIPQKKMALFLCDIYVPELKLVIECDGDYWHSLPDRMRRDVKKDSWLRSHGQNVVRLTETEINADVVAAVDRALDPSEW